MTGTVRSLLQLLLVWSPFRFWMKLRNTASRSITLPDAESDEDEDFKEQTRLLRWALGLQMYRVGPLTFLWWFLVSR